jgi:hypothetical protein
MVHSSELRGPGLEDLAGALFDRKFVIAMNQEKRR